MRTWVAEDTISYVHIIREKHETHVVVGYVCDSSRRAAVPLFSTSQHKAFFVVQKSSSKIKFSSYEAVSALSMLPSKSSKISHPNVSSQLMVLTTQISHQSFIFAFFKSAEELLVRACRTTCIRSAAYAATLPCASMPK